MQNSSVQLTEPLWINPLHQPLDPHSDHHLVQFYETESYLTESVVSFIAPGLEAGEGAILIAERAHLEAFEKLLKAKGINTASMKKAGQLLMFEAAETLSLFMDNGLPDENKFRSVISSVVEKMKTRYPKVRAYGEMVNILWQEGNLPATIELEEIWNRFIKSSSLNLLCGYLLKNFSNEGHAEAFHHICSTHSHVIPADDFVELQDQETQRRMIASLQQQAKALKSEIAGRKEMERELYEALRLRDEFLSIAGHELKTPLTALMIQSQILRRTINDNPTPELTTRMKKSAEVCERNATRLSTLIDQLLDLTRIRLGRMQLEARPVDLELCVKNVVNSLSSPLLTGELHHSDQMINIAFSEPILGIWDQDRIEQVITNLLTNAIKYGQGKPITVTAALDSKTATAKLVVKDHGMGIDLNDQTRIFGRFERACPANHFGGLGLGLYIVKQIVDAHGGTIGVESFPGEGAAFTVVLPLTITH